MLPQLSSNTKTSLETSCFPAFCYTSLADLRLRGYEILFPGFKIEKLRASEVKKESRGAGKGDMENVLCFRETVRGN